MPEPAPFSDLPSCRTWLAGLSLASPGKTQALLAEALERLHETPLSAGERLVLLECLRETLVFVQHEEAKRFLDRPLPLAATEQATAEAVVSSWRKLATGYQLCLDACTEAAAENPVERATICQRLLATLADEHYDRVRAGEAVPETFWRRLHAAYAEAERLGVSETAVADPVRRGGPQSPREAYVETVLFATGSPHELPARQQAWVAYWARRWASKVTVSATPPELDGHALPLCVDLAGSRPPAYLPFSGAGARWLATDALRRSLKARLERLARGGPEDAPAHLGLGDDCVQPACGEVLRRVYPRWIKGGVRRRHERLPFEGACTVSCGFDAIHYYLAGRRVALGIKATSGTLLREREELALFDRLARRFAEEYSRNQGFFLEDWQVAEDWQGLDRSDGGLRLARPLSQPGARLSLGQLIAVRPTHGSGFTLSSVRWLRTTEQALIIGLELIPGRPQAVAIRGTGLKAEAEPYRPAFWLPDANDSGSVILAPASFRANRIMELWDGQEAPRHLRLKTLLRRGADFEWIEATFIGP